MAADYSSYRGGSDKPNILFIMTDQQRSDTIGENRHPLANYPRMEALADESVSFESFYPAATACVPSRMSFLTGQHAWTNKAAGNTRFMKGDEQTWMSILRDNGYRCVSVGKTHEVHAGSTHLQTFGGHSYGGQRDWDDFHPEASPEKEENYFDILATRQACAALNVLSKKENPFALFFGLHAPHPPFIMPEKYLSHCNPDDAPLPEARSEGELEGKPDLTAPRVKRIQNAITRALGEEIGDMNSDENVLAAVYGYYCLVKMADDCLGMVLDEMEELGLLDNTIIVFTSDHGEMLGEHWLFNKGPCYEGETHIPFMIRFPKKYKAGTKVKGLASSIDYAPTIMDLLGIEDIPLPGKSLMPMIESDENVRDHIVCCAGGTVMLRTEEHKICYDCGAGAGELYDMKNDPNELNNLYHDPEYADLKNTMIEKMLKSRMQDDQDTSRLTQHDFMLKDEAATTLELEILCDNPTKYMKKYDS